MKHLYVSFIFRYFQNKYSAFLDYLLSNNLVNSIILHKFDFIDEEITAYYISFLKTLSLKLNTHSINFFYNEVRSRNKTYLALINLDYLEKQ